MVAVALVHSTALITERLPEKPPAWLTRGERTMHRMKGLEFRCVAVAGVMDGTVPMKSAVTPVDVDAQQHQEDLDSELSVGCSWRARGRVRHCVCPCTGRRARS